AESRAAEGAGAGAARRHGAAGAAARTAPGDNVGLGAGAFFALAPGEPLLGPECLGVGEPAGAVALQDDAAAARHNRDLVEIEDQHAAIVADQRDEIAFGRHAEGGHYACGGGDELLSGAGLRPGPRSNANTPRPRL